MVNTPFSRRNKKTNEYFFYSGIELTNFSKQADIFVMRIYPNKKHIFPDLIKRWKIRKQNISSRHR